MDTLPATPTEISILSIDAWRNPDGWDWNNWFKVGTCPITMCDLTPRKLLRYLRAEGFLAQRSKGRVAIDDDQYNLVIVDRHTREPLFALAYGEAH